MLLEVKSILIHKIETETETATYQPTHTMLKQVEMVYLKEFTSQTLNLLFLILFNESTEYIIKRGKDLSAGPPAL